MGHLHRGDGSKSRRDMNDQTTPAALHTDLDLMSMNGGTGIHRAAIECSIFAALGRGPASARSFDDACGLHERAVGWLLEALCNIGTVRRENIR